MLPSVLDDVISVTPAIWLNCRSRGVATLDADGHPIHTAIAVNGHTYSGDFSEFLEDRMDMMVNFSHHIVLQVDGKTLPVRQQVTTKLVSMQPTVK